MMPIRLMEKDAVSAGTGISQEMVSSGANSVRFRLSVVSPMGEFSNGIYRADDSGFHLESNFHNFSYVLSVTDLYTIPEQADEKYIELTDLSFSEASRMMTELCSSFGITLESFLEQLGELFGG